MWLILNTIIILNRKYKYRLLQQYKTWWDFSWSLLHIWKGVPASYQAELNRITKAGLDYQKVMHSTPTLFAVANTGITFVQL